MRIATGLYLAVFLEGLMLSAPGPTLDSLAGLTGSSLGEIGVLFTANGLGFVVGALVAGRLFARFHGTRLLAIGLMVMAAAAFAVPEVRSLPGVLALFVAIGAAIGLTDVGGNTLIVWLYRERVAPYMNTLHLFWGVGAFIAPLAVAGVASATGVAVESFRIFALATFVGALWLLASPSPEVPATARPGESRAVLRRHSFLVVMMGVLFFIHVGAELAFGGWVYSYATALDIGAETTARVLNAMFWGGLVAGRVVAIPVSTRLRPATMIQLDLLGAAASLVIVASVPGWGIWVGTALFGASIASIFASCLNYAGEQMPTTSQGTSVFLIGASLGSMTLPWVVGRLFSPVGPEAMVYVVGIAIAAGLGVFAAIRARLSPSAPPRAAR